MSERPDQGAAGPVSHPPNDLHANRPVLDPNAPHLPNPPPAVSHVLLQPVASHTPTAAAGYEWGHSATPDPITRRLADLTDGLRPVYDIPPLACHPAVAAAVACPDLFLFGVHPDERVRRVSELVEAAVHAGQRVLLISRDAEGLTHALVDRLGSVVRVVGAGEGAGQRLPSGADHAANRDVLAERTRELTARLTVTERWEALTADEAAVRAELDQLSDRAVAVAEATDEFRQLVSERLAAVARAEQRAAAARELEDLRQHAAHPSGGFFKRLFGMAKPSDGLERVAVLEGQIRELDDSTPVDPEEAFRVGRERLLAAHAAALRADLEGRLARIEHERESLSPVTVPADCLRAELAVARQHLAELDAGRTTQATELRQRVRVVVAPPTVAGIDSLASGSHPDEADQFHRVVWADGEAVSHPEFLEFARFGAAWVLVGAADDPRPSESSTYSAQPPSTRPTFFADLWNALHDAAWTVEGARPLVRLRRVPAAERRLLACEPLLDRPDVEVRFTEDPDGLALAEVAFPAGMPVAEAKTLLATEAGEVRLTAIGPALWHETADGITCCWPAVEANGSSGTADLGDGVSEQVCGEGPDALTAAVHFATCSGWTRQAATDWLTARLTPASPRAVGVR